MLETAVVNEPSVFETLKFYCISLIPELTLPLALASASGSKYMYLLSHQYEAICSMSKALSQQKVYTTFLTINILVQTLQEDGKYSRNAMA